MPIAKLSSADTNHGWRRTQRLVEKTFSSAQHMQCEGFAECTNGRCEPWLEVCSLPAARVRPV
ncbi:hypothetical protein RBWH47_04330 [Rhodopirellula baltica WH47]|uniref:Uncharacterized protein n=2 Tax=Rhodopirellula baltica TaxID=265606 RepID=F2APT8_RHOBT|nr:hypothetical protein RBWH47_04330 [Rhodopirellula baltica WH47]ELP34819.1 hypothetical protein RBSWK_01326 [Rhodopirellula baltica SWK14]